jgi:phosphodiesterase/alkaline phosphatase D-like protein
MKRNLLKIFIAMYIIINLIVVCTNGSFWIDNATALQAPEQVHIATTGDPSEMVVTWVTWGPTPTSTVEYGTTIGSYGSIATGSTHTYSDGGWVGEIHDVLLTGLVPNTQYFYRVGDSQEGWSSEFEFRSAPSDDGNFSFAAYADHGESSRAQTTTSNIQNDPSIGLIIHPGDL